MASGPGMSRRGPPPRPQAPGAAGPPPRPPPTSAPGPPPTSSARPPPTMPAQAPPPIRFDDEQQNLRQRRNTGQQSRAYVQANMPFADFKDTRKKGARRGPAKPQSRMARFRSWVFRKLFLIGFLYTLFGALFSCSSSSFAFDYNPRDSRAVCRNLAHTKKHVLPIITPYVQAAHAKIDPYTGPYIKAASPYAQSAWKTTKPYYKKARKHSIKTYKKHVEPARKKAVKKTRQMLDPHVKVIRGHYDQKVQPHVDTVQDALKPYQKMYMRDVAPYLSQAYSYSLSAGSASYVFYVDQVHPHVVEGLQQTHAFYINSADPAMRRAYSLYIRPQADKLMAKIFARKAHAIGAEVLKETKEHVREVQEEAKSSASASSSSSEAAHTPTASAASSTGIAASVERAASTASKAMPKVQHYVPDTLLGGGGPQYDDPNMSPERAAAIDKALAAELETVKKQLEAWETGMTSLFNKEYKLFTERIAEMRDSRMLDLPDHFDGLFKTAEDQVAATIDKLAQKYERITKDTESDAEARTSQLATIADTPLKKLRQARTVADDAIKTYAVELAKDEAKARDASVSELRSFVREAIASYGTLLDDAEFERTVEDFNGWDNGMVARVRMFASELDDLRRGNGTLRGGLEAVDLRKDASNLAPHFAELRKKVDTLFDGAVATVESYAKASPLDNVALAVEGVRKQASDISAQAVQSMSDAVNVARSRLGIAADTARSASQNAKGSATEAVAAAGEAVSSASEDAVAAASSAVTSEPEPAAELDTDDNVMRIQPVDMPGDGVDAEGQPVDDGHLASEQFGATGSGEGRGTVLDAVEQVEEAEAEAATPLDTEEAAAAAGEPVEPIEPVVADPVAAEPAAAEPATPEEAPVAEEATPDKVAAEEPAEPAPEPVISIQPVEMPGDGVDAEGKPVAASAAESTPEPTEDRHEEL